MTKPPPDPWAVILATTMDGADPLGAGVVVDHQLILTCEHVAFHNGRLREQIWVAFPKAGVPWKERRRVRQCVANGRVEENLDMVLLELDEPVPGSVTPARLRCTSAADLAGRSWWAFGQPKDASLGRSAHGAIGDPLMFGHVQLDRHSEHGLAKGFSGAGVWCPDYQAVVGIVVTADAAAGDGNALTLFHADQMLPEMKLSTLAAWRAEDADDTALAAWGWMLATDDEARRHWLPRARGVAVETERGSRFRGRTAALRRLVDWLDRAEPDRRPLVVTGSPGVGKSAVLGRVVTTADRAINESLPPDDDAVRATVDSIACAVHAKGKSALEVAAEIARAASLGLPARPADLPPALRDRLARRPRTFNVVIDALDEAADPAEARLLVHEVILPLVRECAEFGAQLVVGTRRADDLGDLLAEFGTAIELVDLDSAEYFTESDLAAYALVTLQLGGHGSPYADSAAALPVAHRIAALAGGNFLVAGLVARAHALRDAAPVDPVRVSFVGTVGDALDAYLANLPTAGDAPARLALTALAFAETPGLPLSLWRAAVSALGGRATEPELAAFAQRSAANFLVETGSPDAPVYRLFHQALNEALLAGRARESTRVTDERDLVYAWVRYGHMTGWSAAPEYLVRSLPQHAARTGLVDTLLNDDDYLLNARIGRLLPVADGATTSIGQARAQLLQRTPYAAGAEAVERAALFSVVDAVDDLGSGLVPDGDVPYRALWARTPRRLERTVLEGHSEAVFDVCAVTVDGRDLLASAGEDGTVRLWDPLTCQTERILDCHDDCIRGLYAVIAGGVVLLATAGHDSTVRLWDPRTGGHVRTLVGHGDWVRNLCAVPLPDGRSLLASASDDRTVRLWDPADGSTLHTLRGHHGWVTAVCHLPVGEHGLVASTGFDGVIRLWDPVTGAARGSLHGHDGWVTTLTPVGGTLASAGYDGTVRLWNPVTGAEEGRFEPGAGPLTDLCTLDSGGAVLLCSTGEDGIVRMWDVRGGTERPALRGHVNWIRAICALPVGDRELLATAGDDGTVRLWDATTGEPETVMDGGRLGPVTAVCAVPSSDGNVLASTGADGSVRLWSPATGEPRGELTALPAANTDLCAITGDGRVRLAAASENRLVQIWDLDEGFPEPPLQGHYERVNAVRPIEVDGRTLVASAADDETVRLWDADAGTLRGVLLGHRNWITALAVLTRDGRQALASGDKNGTVRLWDPDGTLLWERHGHHDAVNALCAVTVHGRDALAAAGADRVIRLWRPDGTPLITLTGHTEQVTGVCAVPLRTPGSVSRQILASTSHDRTVRLWDPLTGRALRSIPVYHRALTCQYVDGVLVLGLECGLLALSVSGAPQDRRA